MNRFSGIAWRCPLLVAAVISALILGGPLAGARRPTLVGATPPGATLLDQQVQALLKQLRNRGESAAEVHLALAALYAKASSPKAAQHLAAAQKLGMSPVRTDLVKAMALRRQGRFDAALATLLNVLVTHPGQPYALVELWKTLYEAGLRGAAIGLDRDTVRRRLASHGMHFPEALDLSAKAASHSRKLTALGYSQLLAGHTRYAAELFQAAIDHLPSNARAHRGLGLAWEKEPDLQRATGALLLYLELAPEADDADEIDRRLMGYWTQRTQ